MSQSAAADRSFFGHPKGLSTLFFTEIWERLSYYGMRALLILFMTKAVTDGGLGFDESKAGAIYGLYTAGVYLMALPGGWVADRILGKRRTIFWGGVLLALGHFCLAFPNTHTFFGGLLLIVLGTGLLKPNVSAIVGDLYPEGGSRRDAGFSLFYMGVNLGAFSGPLICSALGEKIGWHYGFAAAGVGMVIGLIQYRLGMEKNLRGVGEMPPLAAMTPVQRAERRSAIKVLVASVVGGLAIFGAFYLGLVPLSVQQIARLGTAVILAIAAAFFTYVLFFSGLDRQQKLRVLAFVVLFLFSAVFWSGFEQTGSSLNLFAENLVDRQLEPMTQYLFLGTSIALLAGLGYGLWRHRSRHPETSPSWMPWLFGLLGLGIAALAFFLTKVDGSWLMPTGFLQGVNPAFIVIFAPVFAVLWLSLGRFNPSTGAKFGIGMVLLGLGFVVLYFGALRAEGGTKVLPMWLIVNYLLHTFGELFVSPVGLSTATKLSPPRFMSQMMGLWFISISLGNLIGGQIAGLLGNTSMSQIFFWVAGITIGSGLVMLALSPWVKRWMAGAE